MAEYTNLTSLKKLKKGDTITYDTTTTIDFDGAIVKVELYGKRSDSTSTLYKNAGYTSFIIDTKALPEPILSFNKDTISGSEETLKDTRGDLVYGNSDSLYYRIAVAGNASERYYYNGGYSCAGALGGGIDGGNGSRSSSAVYASALGGSQTTGGSPAYASSISSSTLGTAGSFGSGGSPKYSGYGGEGGYGWYGGGGSGRASSSATNGGSGGGGSGFVIGHSTTTYPSGYLGDDTTLQSTIAAAITEAILTQGGSTETTPKMVLTIVKPSASGLPFYNGKEYTEVSLNFYDGTQFRKCNVFYYDGNTFRAIEGGSE